MEKKKTTVKIAGQEYSMVGYETEEYMHKIAIYVDHRMKEIKNNFFHLSTSLVAVLTSLNIVDDLFKAQDERDETKKENVALHKQNAELEQKIASLQTELQKCHESQPRYSRQTNMGNDKRNTR